MLTPTRDTDTEVLNLALELVALCRAVPVVMDADAHDRAVALVSHTPQLVSSMVAARLEDADETAVRLCGQGIRDVTRIAASDPRMWIDILSANPGPVADVLAEVAADLDETVRALRALQSADEDEAPRAAPAASRTCCGAATRAGSGCPASTAPPRAAYEIVAVLIGDQPGELARIFADAGRAGVNIEDVRIEHATGQQAGLVQLMVEPQAAPVLTRGAARAGLVDPAVSGPGRSGTRAGAVGAGRRAASNLVRRPSPRPAVRPTPCTRKVSATVETARPDRPGSSDRRHRRPLRHGQVQHLQGRRRPARPELPGHRRPVPGDHLVDAEQRHRRRATRPRSPPPRASP